MIHECNRALEDVWSAAALGRPLSPAPDARVLDHAFLTRRCDAAHHVFSHVGPAVCALHGRDLVGQNLVSLWRRDDRAAVRDAIETGLARGAPVLARTCGRRLNGASLEFEITLWPLQGPTAARDRLLGAIAPCVSAPNPRPILEHGVDELTFLPSLDIGADGDPPLPRSTDIAQNLIEARLR